MRPHVSIGVARASYLGPALSLDPHTNAVATVVVGLESEFSIQRFDPEVSRTCSVVVIPPRTEHHLVARGRILFLYLDAIGDDYQRLQTLDLESAKSTLMDVPADELSTWNVDRLCAALGVAGRETADARIVKVLRELDMRPQEFQHVEQLAAMTGLSPSRFQSLFSSELGVPFRRYRTWRKMAVVARALSEGHDLTQAAHDAGFSGSAHLSTTFRKLFGLAPSSLLALTPRITFTTPEAKPKLAWE